MKVSVSKTFIIYREVYNFHSAWFSEPEHFATSENAFVEVRGHLNGDAIKVRVPLSLIDYYRVPTRWIGSNKGNLSHFLKT